MTGQSRLSLSSLSSSIHSSLFRPFSPSPHPYIYIYIYVQTPRERGGRKRDRTRGTRVDRRRIKPMRSLQLCSLSFSLRLSLRGYAPFDALGDVHTIKQGNTRDKGGSKRTLRLGAQPSRLPPRILRETYCLRISIFRATRQTQLFFLSFYSSFSFPFFFLVCFVSFRFVSIPFLRFYFSFFFFPCSLIFSFSSLSPSVFATSARGTSSRYVTVVYLVLSRRRCLRAVIKNFLPSDTYSLSLFVLRVGNRR